MTFTYSATTITLPSPIADKTKVTPSKWQNRVVCEDGSVKTSDRQVVEWFIDLTFRATYAQMITVRNFFKSTVKYSLLPFTFTPDAGLDVGAGLSTAVTCYLWQDDVPEPNGAGGRFEMHLLLRAQSTGTGTPS